MLGGFFFALVERDRCSCGEWESAGLYLVLEPNFYEKVELNLLRLRPFLYEAYLWIAVPPPPRPVLPPLFFPRLGVNQGFISLRFEKLPLDFIQMKVRSCGCAAGLLSPGRFGFK